MTVNFPGPPALRMGGDVAKPFESVLTLQVVQVLRRQVDVPSKLTVAPEPGAVKITVAPDTGLLEASRTKATSGRYPEALVCGVPL